MNYSDNQIRDALTRAVDDNGISINGEPGEEQWPPYAVGSVRRILDALDSTPGQPLSDTDIDLAYSTATGRIPSPETTRKMREFIEIINQTSPSDDWQECRFDEVEATDEAVLFEFKDGSKIQGKPHSRNMTDIDLWVGYEVRYVTLSEVRKENAKIYRIPQKVVHPDPSRHPFILVTGYEDLEDDPDGVLLDDPVPYFWNGDWYDAHHMPLLRPDQITDWVPAEMVAKDV